MSPSLEQTIETINEMSLTKRGRRLNEAEKHVLWSAWEDIKYQDAADRSEYKVGYLQCEVAPKLWTFLTDVLGVQISKKKLRLAFESGSYSKNSNDEQIAVTEETKVDVLGEQLPVLDRFYGRKSELGELEQLISQKKCVAITGMAGVGKSSLAAKIAQISGSKAEPRFEVVIWKSLNYAPPLPVLLAWLLECLNCKVSKIPEDTQARVSLLIKELQSQRSLIVLDSAEAILQGKQHSNPYGDAFVEYGFFLRRLVEEVHSSCLLLLSRDAFVDLSKLELGNKPVYQMKLDGLDADAAKQILHEKGLAPAKREDELVKQYCGNPLLLKLVAGIILDYLGGNVDQFLQRKTVFLGDLFKEILDQLTGPNGRVTSLEIQILNWLSSLMNKGSELISVDQMLDDFASDCSISELLQAVEMLDQRSLIQVSRDPSLKAFITLQPVIHKYVTRYLRPSEKVSPKGELLYQS